MIRLLVYVFSDCNILHALQFHDSRLQGHQSLNILIMVFPDGKYYHCCEKCNHRAGIEHGLPYDYIPVLWPLSYRVWLPSINHKFLYMPILTSYFACEKSDHWYFGYVVFQVIMQTILLKQSLWTVSIFLYWNYTSIETFRKCSSYWKCFVKVLHHDHQCFFQSVVLRGDIARLQRCTAITTVC